MKQTNLANIAISGLLLFTGCAFGTPHNEGKEMEAKFISPPNEYRPQPFWHINGELTKEGIYRQITDAYQKDGFGGVAVLSLTPAKMWGGKEICPGTTPEYLSESYFDRYRDILA